MPKVLSDEELLERFNAKHKMSLVQIKRLFPEWKFDKYEFRFLEKGIRHVVTFDIEAINFDARMGFIICWYALKWDVVTGKKEMIYDQIEPADMKGKYKEKTHNFDERLLVTLSETLKDADLVAGHYITKYDIPYFKIRCRLTDQHHLVPDYNDCKVMDTWKIMKQKYNAYNSGGNSLRNAGYIFNGHDDKTSVELQKWKSMYYVKRKDWKTNRKYICDHCEIDVLQNFDVFLKQSKEVPIGGASI